jgi:DNA-binding ferritin-like protein (Dps family)
MERDRKALIQVLGAVAYGELKAYEGARTRAQQAPTERERATWRRQAAEELRHHKGFVRRLEALGADPERAMRPYRRALDTYHANESDVGIEGAVLDFLGEGVADDLLQWLHQVADPDTAAFIESVQLDEVNHEARAAAELRHQLRTSDDHRRATLAAGRMVTLMLQSGGTDFRPFLAFVRLGRSPQLIGALVGGQIRRLRAIGLRPLGLPVPA